MSNTRNNNFDLLRLIAALQVVVLHSKKHLKIENDLLDQIANNILNFLPGVQIFFFISGFLIYASFERNKDNLTQFFINRFFRIYPALWVCFLVTVALLCYDFEGKLSSLLSPQMFAWAASQLTFFQFYTPEVLNFWGSGTPNGSLWTISVEIQYYLIIPLLYYLFSKSKNFLIPFTIVFMLSVGFHTYIGHVTNTSGNLISKLGWVFVVTHLHFFLIGIAIKKYWSLIAPFFEHKLVYWLLSYVAFIYVSKVLLGFDLSSYFILSPISLIVTLLLAGVTFSFAFSFHGLSTKLLKGNDISYGIYIYHMLVLNFLMQREYFHEMIYLVITVTLTTILAFLSWKLIEKPSLNFKKTSTPIRRAISSKRTNEKAKSTHETRQRSSVNNLEN